MAEREYRDYKKYTQKKFGQVLELLEGLVLGAENGFCADKFQPAQKIINKYL